MRLVGEVGRGAVVGGGRDGFDGGCISSGMHVYSKFQVSCLAFLSKNKKTAFWRPRQAEN